MKIELEAQDVQAIAEKVLDAANNARRGRAQRRAHRLYWLGYQWFTKAHWMMYPVFGHNLGTGNGQG